MNADDNFNNDLIQYSREEVDCLGQITITRYDERDVDTLCYFSVNDLSSSMLTHKVNWINFIGLTCKEQHETIHRVFNVPMEMTDALVSSNPQSKIIIRKDKVFISMRMIYPDKDKPYRFISEPICFILSHDCLLSFQVLSEDVFTRVEECLFEEDYFLRHCSADSLLLELMKSILNNYEYLLSTLKEQMENLEEAIINHSTVIDEYVFSTMKKKCNHLFKITTSLEIVIDKLIESKLFLVEERSLKRLRRFRVKLGELVVKVSEYDEDFITLYQLFMSYKSNNLNAVMKTLTLFSVTFMPLSFLAGLYGMNFKYFPELEMRYGYYGLLSFMALVVVFILVMFKKKKWF